MRRFIRWNSRNNRFYFCQKSHSFQSVSVSLGFALLKGLQVQLHFCERDRTRERFNRCSWSVMVDPEYVQDMLKFVHAHGWFWDEVPEHKSRQDSDHDFDGKKITPGLNWRAVTEMRLGADQMEVQARRLEIEADWRENRRKKKAILSHVEALRQRAVDTRRAADEMLRCSVPPCE